MVIKALRYAPGKPMRELAARYPVDYILLDSAAGNAYGGSGKTFPWNCAVELPAERLFLAGGLTPENVAEAVRVVRPYAVDVASGVELRPGKKDPARVKEFVTNAKNA